MAKKKSKATGAKPIIVTVADHALKDIQQLADRLAAAGMDVKQVLPITGTITGSCDPAVQSALQKIVHGKAKVGDDLPAYLPPPGEPQ